MCLACAHLPMLLFKFPQHLSDHIVFLSAPCLLNDYFISSLNPSQVIAIILKAFPWGSLRNESCQRNLPLWSMPSFPSFVLYFFRFYRLLACDMSRMTALLHCLFNLKVPFISSLAFSFLLYHWHECTNILGLFPFEQKFL